MRMPKFIPPSKPHFFQPIIRGSLLHIWIPSAFQKKYLVGYGEKFEGEAILRSHTYAGRSWNVKLKESKFQDGWSNFYRAHNLHVGDFLVFKYEGDLVFHVMVFDGSTCEIEYPPLDVINLEEKRSNKRSREQATSDSKMSCSWRSKHPHFVATMKAYQFFPIEFARSNIPRNKGSIVLKDEKGRAWPINLYHRSRGGVSLAQGRWIDFKVANGLKDGDECLFELINLPDKKEDLMELKVSII